MTDAAPVREGDVLAGKYRVDRVLGVGGMGVVVAAHHLHLDERVAIKFLLPDAMNNAEAVARFDREARAAVKIKSEHVARVIDVGKLETGAPYMVMEYLDGRDLAAWLAERGPLPVAQAVEFVLQACEAIAEAHALGIVHRDLKPANLYCIRRPDGALSIKVLDFGISKTTGMGASMGMTRTHTVMGSPLYMSPEQMESSRGVDARTDIWALGVILFELVTSQVPFQGEAITELALKIVTAPTPPVSQYLPGAPPGFDSVIHRCLEKDRARRYANVSELANDLLPFGPASARLSVDRISRILGGAGAPRPSFHSSPPQAQLQPVQPTQAMTDAAWGQTGGAQPAPARARSRLPAVIAGVALLGIAASAVTLASLRRPTVVAASAPVPSLPPTLPLAATSSSVAPSFVDPPMAERTTASAAPAAPSVAYAPSPTAPRASHGGAHGAGPSRAASAPETGTAPVAPLVAATAAPPAPTATATAKPTTKPSCDPPYFVDASGHKQYKPECL